MFNEKTKYIAIVALSIFASNQIINGQDFGKLVKDVQIDFPESKGIIRFSPGSGIPFPKPKTMEMEPGGIILAKKGKILCSIIISERASITERSAAREISEQIAFMTGLKKGPEILSPKDKIPTQAVCLLGVRDKFFNTANLDIPKQPEGFAVQTGKWKGKEAIFIGGRDRFGVYWGVQTLKQMLLKGKKEEVLAPNGKIWDWPDAQYRLAICLEYLNPERLAYLVRNGRANATALQLMSTHKIFKKEILISKIDNLHKRGILSFAFISFVRINRYLKNNENRNICPISDMDFIKSLAKTAFEAGVDGLSINFDDLHPKDLMHFKDCPKCSKKFKSVAEWQVYAIKNIIAYAQENGWGEKLVLVCPTLYFRAEEEYKPYANIGLTKEKYYPKFCNFPGSENVKFYHCDFTMDNLKLLKDSGLKNYAWWNNGPWSGIHDEVWGYATGLSRMAYSWGMYNRDLPKSGKEIIYSKKLSNLKELKGKTDFVFTGTNNLLGQAIGCLFAWDMENYISRENEFQAWFVNNYCKTNIIDKLRAWEWTVKPLLAKCVQKQPLDENDFKFLELANILMDKIQSITKKTGQPFISTKGMKELLLMLEKYKKFYSNIKIQESINDRISFKRENGTILSISHKNYLKNASGSPKKPMIMENWKAQKFFKLADAIFLPASEGSQARIISKTPKKCAIKMENLDVDISDFESLSIACNLSRGTQISIKALIDGIESSGTPISWHSPEWQKVILPLDGKKLTSLTISLRKDPEISNPSEYCEAFFEPLRMEPRKTNVDTLMITNDPIKLVNYKGKESFLLSKSKLTTADDRFTLNKRSFSIEANITPIQVMRSKLIGTRPAYSFIGRGIPGWILGIGNGRCGFVFTLEDKNKTVSYVHGGGRPKLFAPMHVIAVRDFTNRKLRLYVNGEKVGETEEKGSGDFGDEQRTLGLSFDAWTGSYLTGLLRFVKIHDHALSETEAQELFSR